MEIRLEPNLSHCIETVAKREYETVMKLLLSDEQGDEQLEEKCEMLRLFLESADFGQLRGRCQPFLAEGKRVTFTLRLNNGVSEYDMEIG